MKNTIVKKSLKKIKNNKTIKNNKKLTHSKKNKNLKDKQIIKRKIVKGGSILDTAKSFILEFQGKSIPLHLNNNPEIQNPLSKNDMYTSNHKIY